MYLKQKAILTASAYVVCLLLPYARQAPPLSPYADDGFVAATVTADTHQTSDPSNRAAPATSVPVQHTTDRPVQMRPTVPTTPHHPQERINDQTFKAGGKTYPLRTYKTLAIPNDPNATQWWTTSTGLPTAWGYSTGTGARIAIIDTGFALAHEEFAGRWLTNSGEQGATLSEASSGQNCTNRSLPLNKSCNGLDDDDNGFVDDVTGWDFYSDTANVQAGKTNPSGSAVSHGTGVAGVAAATGNNGVGIAGVSWNAKILPLQAMSDDGVGDTLTIARAIMYATDRGVNVINMSLGSDQPDDYLRGAIQYAIEHNVILVAAAGNDGCDCMVYPARYPEVVGVGAVTSAGLAASFSSYGTSLDVLAPGSGIRTTAWSAASPTNTYNANVAGTSFAAPFVSGLLANAVAIQPNATWGELVHTMLSQADHKTLTAASPYSTTLGTGVVLAGAYMQRLGTPLAESVRYDLSLYNADALDAVSAKQCATDFPTAPFYEVKTATSTFYTISPLEAAKQQALASTVTQKGYVCTHLPTDTVGTVSRLINSTLEFSNTTAR